MGLTSRTLSWLGILALLVITAMGATCLYGCGHFTLVNVEKVQVGPDKWATGEPEVVIGEYEVPEPEMTLEVE